MQPYRKKLRQYWLVNLMFQYLYACLATRVTTHQSKKQPNYLSICPKSSHNSVLSALFQASPKSCQTLDLLLESNLSLSIFDDESSHTACCHPHLITFDCIASLKGFSEFKWIVRFFNQRQIHFKSRLRSSFIQQLNAPFCFLHRRDSKSSPGTIVTNQFQHSDSVLE